MDVFALVALGFSAVSLACIVYLISFVRRRVVEGGPNASTLESTLGEVKESVSSLHIDLRQLTTSLVEVRKDTGQLTQGMEDMKEFASLMKGSSQKKGLVGEVIVRNYLERLPRELWEEQFVLPASGKRVDYVLRLNSGGTQLYLPIDVKFSLPDDVEDFEREANKRAEKRADELAKYIIPGATTGFAVMVLAGSVYYALTADTINSIQQKNVVPCPPEGIIILSSLVLKAHQTVVLTKGLERLTTYVQNLDGKLGQVDRRLSSLTENLRKEYDSSQQVLLEVRRTREELNRIATHLDEALPNGTYAENRPET
ncbi:MAG: DNA recombination protein RmuC [Thermoprotei archaeon]